MGKRVRQAGFNVISITFEPYKGLLVPKHKMNLHVFSI